MTGMVTVVALATGAAIQQYEKQKWLAERKSLKRHVLDQIQPEDCGEVERLTIILCFLS